MQIVHTITEASAQSNQLFNAAHVFSSLNRKMIEPVDGKGNAQAFALNIKVYSDAANTATFETASNSYVTKQAVKAWFKVWKASMRSSGFSMKDLGPYGRHFKPRLESTEDILGSSAEAGRGEWNYTDLVTQPPSQGSADGIEASDLVDKYSLHLIGTTAEDSEGGETRKFTNVGMINSWLASRRSTTGSDSDAVPASKIFDQDNPLLLARGDSVISEKRLDEVRDLQADLPPYDNQDFDALYTQALVKTNADLMSECDIVAPCGLVRVTTTAAATIVFTLVGIGDM